jgi:hypothetical protein
VARTGCVGLRITCMSAWMPTQREHTRIRFIFSILAFVLPALASAQPSVSEKDNLFRAAYCVGALTERANRLLAQNSEPDRTNWTSCEEPELQRSLGSQEACVNGLIELMQWIRKQSSDKMMTKQKRYADYVMAHVVSGTDVVRLLPAIREKGISDARKIPEDAYQKVVNACGEKCGTGSGYEQCYVSCVERETPNLSNVMRCILLPDGLPF